MGWGSLRVGSAERAEQWPHHPGAAPGSGQQSLLLQEGPNLGAGPSLALVSQEGANTAGQSPPRAILGTLAAVSLSGGG